MLTYGQPLPFAEELIIGDAFHSYFELTHWEYFTARQGEHVVQFTGSYEEQQLSIQVIVTDNRSSFELGAIKQNNIVLSPNARWHFLKTIALQNNRVKVSYLTFTRFYL